MWSEPRLASGGHEPARPNWCASLNPYVEILESRSDALLPGTTRNDTHAPFLGFATVRNPRKPEGIRTTTSAQSPGRAAKRTLIRNDLACKRQQTRAIQHEIPRPASGEPQLGNPSVTVIALWLGHEQISTTNIYLHADMTHKQQAIDRAKPLDAKPGRYRPPDTLLKFLEDL